MLEQTPRNDPAAVGRTRATTAAPHGGASAGGPLPLQPLLGFSGRRYGSGGASGRLGLSHPGEVFPEGSGSYAASLQCVLHKSLSHGRRD